MQILEFSQIETTDVDIVEYIYSVVLLNVHA
jgi:hypothetical protein